MHLAPGLEDPRAWLEQLAGACPALEHLTLWLPPLGSLVNDGALDLTPLAQLPSLSHLSVTSQCRAPPMAMALAVPQGGLVFVPRSAQARFDAGGTKLRSLVALMLKDVVFSHGPLDSDAREDRLGETLAAACPALEVLRLSYGRQRTDLRLLTGCPRLRDVRLSNCVLSATSAPSPPALSHLSIHSSCVCGGADLLPLLRCPRLAELNISGVRGEALLRFTESLADPAAPANRSLEKLGLVLNRTASRDVGAFIGRLPALRDVTLGCVPGLDVCLDGIDAAPALRSVTLDGVKTILGADALARCAQTLRLIRLRKSEVGPDLVAALAALSCARGGLAFAFIDCNLDESALAHGWTSTSH